MNVSAVAMQSLTNLETQEKSYSDIEEWMIKPRSKIVLDWDNTLKVYRKSDKRLSSRVARDRLLHWKKNLSCELFIISAIRPTRMNLETILMEVERLNLTDVFTCHNDVIVLVSGKYARKGSVIICGYDKAETFVELCSHANDEDEHDIIFFDDEFVNIYNFRAIVPGSQCYLIS